MVFNSSLAPSAAEAVAVNELKAALALTVADFSIPPQMHGPPLDHEQTLLRFVRGYNLKPEEAAKAFNNMLQYRADNNIDAARAAMYAAASGGEELAWPQVLDKFAPLLQCTGGGLMQRIGLSASGMPATLCLLHLYDVRKVIKQGLGPMLIELQQHQDEYWAVTLLTTSQSSGVMRAREDVVGTHDLGLFHFGIGEAKMLMKVLEGAKHYPETSAHIVSVGNGKALLAMYNAVIRPFMPAHTKEKILVLGRDIESQKSRETIGFDEPTHRRLLELTGRVVAAGGMGAGEAVPVS